MSRSSDLGSPRRDMQGLGPFLLEAIAQAKDFCFG